jgi:thiol-disulfide isomerase/thioredoxin
LKLAPVQPDVEYTRPTPAEAAKCNISVERVNGKVGWVVTDPNGLLLRRFLDTNGDNVVDQWCYYKDGIEVYRDIDSDFDGKADQYRWFHTGGSRWGIDRNQDGRIDFWRAISAEEVTAEVVAALAERNPDRFARLVLTPDELKALGLGKERTQRLEEKLAKLLPDFRALALRQQTITPSTHWVQFSGVRPGVVPAGTDGSTRDLRVYENAVAIVETGGRHSQVAIGTLIQVGDVWRLIDVPHIPEGQADAHMPGFFFHVAWAPRGEQPAAEGGETQKLLAELEALDKALGGATSPEKHAEYTVRRADLVEKIARQARTPEDRAMWYHQLADMLAAAAQLGEYREGIKRLNELFERLRQNAGDAELAAYVKFRLLTAEYFLALQEPKVDFAKVQSDWLKNLEQYVAEYPKAADAAEAMLQLGIAQEFANEEAQAKKWYGRILQEFADAPAAQKAAGAIRRLESIGKVLNFSGKSPEGTIVDLAKYRGKVVVIHYWATWSEPARNDLNLLRELARKYPTQLAVIGVSLDVDAAKLKSFLAAEKLPWPQIHEEGGLDSRPANQLGILTLPTTILVDQQGRTVNRSLQVSQLEAELKKLLQ